MEKSFEQQESNSALGSRGVDGAEGTAVLQATGESTGQKSHERIWSMLTNVSVAALALAMSFGFGVATSEVAGASGIVHPVGPAFPHKPGICQGRIAPPLNIQPALLVWDTFKLGPGPRYGGWCGNLPQNDHRQTIHLAASGNENVGTCPQKGAKGRPGVASEIDKLGTGPQHVHYDGPQHLFHNGPQHTSQLLLGTLPEIVLSTAT